ncbi:hypothetical protein Cni_G19508 [Canna indica]|uniref:Reverse transcriptase domain-containing protein n=1 Tax=Canna indica TaxID=4628 RepID=A0AAQ3KLB8_9LILI|nr:hypothetical protein Cni_G19508 [Canna indica]
MAEFQEKAASFIKMEELREAKKNDWQNLKAIIEDGKPKKGDKKKGNHPSRYLPLEAHQIPCQRGKTKATTQHHRRNKCIFHDTYGHTTEECIILSDQLEDLVRIGHLDKYIHRQRERGRSRSCDPRQ